MRSSFRIFNVFGIPVELHISFLILMLFIYVLVLINLVPLQFAVLITFVFFTVILHELSHSYVAKRYGVPIERIILLPIGGVSEMGEIPKDPGQELRISIVGPATNFAIAIFCYIIIISAGNVIPSSISLFINDFLLVNLVLGAFNLLPAFPMDGGRILRAFLAERMDYVRATGIAATIGKTFAIIMAVSIVFFANPFLILIALFVYIGAEQEYRAVLISTLLGGVLVQDIMTTMVDTFSPDTTISEALSRMFQQKHMGYPVMDGEKLVGIVTFDDISKISKDKRNIPISQIMTEKLIVAHPDEHVVDTLQKLTINNIGRLPVVKDGRLVGIVSKTDIMRVLEMLSTKTT